MLQNDGTGRVLVEVENPFPSALQGKLEVRAHGAVLGSAGVQVRPGVTEKFSVPVVLAATPGQIIPAELEFITPDLLPLQSAVIWLHIPQN